MNSLAHCDTLPALIFSRAAAAPETTALVYRDGPQWRRLTWGELAEHVRRMARLLRAIGCQPGDRVVLISENRWEWIVADLAILTARGVHVPLHATLSGEQLAAQIRDAEARLVIVSGEQQFDKLPQFGPELEFGFGSLSRGPSDVRFRAGPVLTPLMDAAANISADEAAQIEAEGCRETRGNDLATILYTSGTTGEPKGVMLTHSNLVSNARSMLTIFDTGADDLRLSLLPWSHVFARTCDLYTWLVSGATLAVAESRERVLEDCRELGPTLINAVPYFFERLVRTAAEDRALDEPGWLRQRLGGRIRACCSGGAALPRHVAEWFRSQDVALVQGYGLTETSPVITADAPADCRIGTVGRPLPGIEVRIAEDGEILTRGPHVMRGYYNKPAATAEVLRDGWFHTGDLGQLDNEGRLSITGRKKELIVTAGGKNIAPTLIEGLLSADPLVHQAIVFGDGRNYLVALIVPDPAALREEIVCRRIAVGAPDALLRHPAVLELYAQRIAQRLRGLSRHEQIGRFRLLAAALTQEAGELTPTLKLRRGVIQQRYAAEISALYESAGP